MSKAKNMIIENIDELTSKGKKKERKILLELVEETLNQVNYYNIIKEVAKLTNNILKIKDLKLNLNDFKNVYVIGGGKNSSFMIRALEEILNGRIAGGVVVEKKGSTTQTKSIPILLGGHPIPNPDSVKAAEEVLRMLNKVGKDDLLIVCVSGGWTALTSKPPIGVPLADHVALHRLLFNSGMTVEQMNIVRNHLSQLGRGKIPMLAKGATTVGLIAVDEVEGEPWGPTVPDSSRFSDAVRILIDFDLLDKIPESIRKYLETALPSEESPTLLDYERNGLKVHNLVIADNIRLCELVQKIASKRGINSFILTTSLRGEAKHVGTVVASIANELSTFNRPFRRPCLVILGGETTVTIAGKSGEGGRNQEVALSAAQHLLEDSKAVIVSIATDGTDGPTDVAGAIVDATLIPRAIKLGLNVALELNTHNSSFVFKQTGDAIYARVTGTNLMDLVLIYVE
ncbi:MAG: DUF4147 domain-containing protein [Nitrososphaeria archaeon]